MNNIHETSGWFLTRLLQSEFKTIHIPKEGSIEFGRDSVDSCIPLPSPTFKHISRKHCVIHCIDGEATVIDHFSAGGTFVEERRISKANPGAIVLKDGDRVGIGTHTNNTDHFYRQSPNVLFYRVCREANPEDVICVSDDEDPLEEAKPETYLVDDDIEMEPCLSNENHSGQEPNIPKELKLPPAKQNNMVGIGSKDIERLSRGTGNENMPSGPSSSKSCSAKRPYLVEIPQGIPIRAECSWEEEYDRLLSADRAAKNNDSITSMSDEEYSDQLYSQMMYQEIKQEASSVDDWAHHDYQTSDEIIDVDELYGTEEEISYNRWKHKLKPKDGAVQAMPKISRQEINDDGDATPGKSLSSTALPNRQETNSDDDDAWTEQSRPVVDAALAPLFIGSAKQKGRPKRRPSLLERDVVVPPPSTSTSAASRSTTKASPSSESSSPWMKGMAKRRASIAEFATSPTFLNRQETNSDDDDAWTEQSRPVVDAALAPLFIGSAKQKGRPKRRPSLLEDDIVVPPPSTSTSAASRSTTKAAPSSESSSSWMKGIAKRRASIAEFATSPTLVNRQETNSDDDDAWTEQSLPVVDAAHGPVSIGFAKPKDQPKRRPSIVDFDFFELPPSKLASEASRPTGTAAPSSETSSPWMKGMAKRTASIVEFDSSIKKKLKRRCSVSDRCMVKPTAKPVDDQLKLQRAERLKEVAENRKLLTAPTIEPVKTGITKPRVKLTKENRGFHLTTNVPILPKALPPSRPAIDDDIVCTQSTTLEPIQNVAMDEEVAAIVDIRPKKMTFKSVERLSNVNRPVTGDSASVRHTYNPPLGRNSNLEATAPEAAQKSPATTSKSPQSAPMGPPAYQVKPVMKPSQYSTKPPRSTQLLTSLPSTGPMGPPQPPKSTHKPPEKPKPSMDPVRSTHTATSCAGQAASSTHNVPMNVPRSQLKGILKSPSGRAKRDKSRRVVFTECNDVFVFTRDFPPSHSARDKVALQETVRWKEKAELCEVLGWRVEWLESAVDGGPFAEGGLLPQTVEEYPSLEAFQAILEPLLKRELWHDLRTHYRTTLHSLPSVELEDVHVQEIPYDMCQISCKAFIPSSNGMQQQWSNDFGVLDYGSSQHRMCRLLAYMSGRQRGNPPMRPGAQPVNCNGQWFHCTLFAALHEMVGLRAGVRFCFRPITTVTAHLRLVKALQMLRCSRLLPNILSPVKNNELIVAQGQAFADMPEVRNGIQARIKPGALNKAQMDVVLSVLDECSRWDQPSISLIQGPPGTGKSRVISQLALELLRLVPERCRVTVLICAQSNTAVDVIAKRLITLQEAADPEEKFKLLRIGSRDRVDPRCHSIFLDDQVRQTMDAENAIRAGDGTGHLKQTYQKELQNLDHRIRVLEDQASSSGDVNRSRMEEFYQRRARLNEMLSHGASMVNHMSPAERFRREEATRRKIIEGAHIVCTTLGSCGQIGTIFPKAEYDVCIIDEATQCTEVYSLQPLAYGMSKLVLVGDINQLPATVLSRECIDAGFRQSLFSRLHDAHVRDHVKMLMVQYRMHPEICRWPNGYFYRKKLKNDPSTFEGARQSFPLKPYLVVSLSFDQELTQQQHEIYNRDEIEFVVGLLKGVVKRCRRHASIAIITPYQRHKNELVTELMANRLHREVQVHSIDSVQGKEYDVVIISMARSNGAGFLSSPERINVALTRARQCLVLCGNFASLRQKPVWKSLLEDAERRELYCHLVNDTIQEGVDHVMRRLRADSAAPKH